MIYKFLLIGEPSVTVKSDDIPAGTLESNLLEILFKDGKIQKHALCKMLNLEGSHELHETPRKRTSMRKMQQAIRNLREMNVPIVSHIKEGIWIATTVDEVVKYCDWIDQKASADIRSMLYIKNRLMEMINVKPTLFPNNL